MLEKTYKALFHTFENATELYKDAEILYNNDKIKRSYTFYHFSFEEGGRFFLLLKVLFKFLESDSKPVKLNYGYLKSIGYEDHIKKLNESVLKLFAFPIYDSILQNDDKLTEKLVKMHEKLEDRITEFNKLKNRSIYISHIDNEFVMPSDSINVNDVEYMKQLANMQLFQMSRIINQIKNEGTFNDLKMKFKK